MILGSCLGRKRLGGGLGLIRDVPVVVKPGAESERLQGKASEKRDTSYVLRIPARMESRAKVISRAVSRTTISNFNEKPRGVRASTRIRLRLEYDNTNRVKPA